MLKKEKKMNTKQATKTNKTKTQSGKINVRYLAVTAMLAAVAFVLQFFEFWIPLTPSFLKMDFSDLPALIGTFAFGPVSGVIICLIKNLLHLTITQTGGVGELANFLLGAAFVLPAGLLYRKNRTRKTALISSLAGAVLMAAASVVVNYFIVYPFYTAFMPMTAIIGMYQAIVPSVDTLLDCLLVFNLPFTLVKALFSVVVTFLIYKNISPILKGVGK